MPTFFIHIHTPTGVIEDREGAEHTDYSEALQEATKAARQMMAAAVLKGVDISGRHMEITAEDGTKLGWLLFKMAVRREV